MLRAHTAVLLLAATFVSCSDSEHAAGLLGGNDRRDLILVSVDTMRASRLPFYSALHSEPRIPTAGDASQEFSIAWLAKQGLVYESAFATAGKTLPSLASFFTGLPPLEHGAVSNMTRLQAPTLTQNLKAAGFRSHARVANRALHKFCGLADGFSSYAVRAKQREPELGSDLLAAADNDITSGHRVMLWAHFMAPHQPYEPLPQFRKSLGIADDIVADNSSLESAHRSPQSQQHLFSAYRDLYDAELATANLYVQQFLSQLDAKYRAANRGPLLDNAIVVFFSDHGEELADRNGYFLHAKSLYSAVTQVPLIVVDKFGAAGQRDSSLVDLSQTMSSVLYGTPMAAETVVSAWHNDYFSIRDKRFTLVHNPQQNPRGPIEPPVDVDYFYPAIALYDRDSDPFELTNIASEHPLVVKRLGRELFEWFESSNHQAIESTDHLDEQALSELGYADDPDEQANYENVGPWHPQRYGDE
ncbi:MAG: sulfatase-like hydrolase/transferase [Planctomycetes bacterium]|nr:sulfatase-like hydrolase/transferase [Planctomycetota bacterium]